MHLEILLEEPSAEAALAELLPRLVPPETSFRLHVHPGKPDLLKRLPARLRGDRAWLPGDGRIVVLVDADRGDCRALKAKLEKIALEAGWTTRSSLSAVGRFQLVNRLAVEELEAWFFGDVEALTAAFPGVPPTLGQKAAVRNPDAVPGGTAEALERVLQKAGYYPGGMPKIEVARRLGRRMDPQRNRSPSFRLFRRTLAEMR